LRRRLHLRTSLLTLLTAGALVAGAGVASADMTRCIGLDPQRPIICIG